MLTSRQSNAAREQALKRLRDAGISIPAWAQANGFAPSTVKAVLYGHSQGLRGQAHKVAIALGLKSGVVVNPKGFVPVPRKHVPLTAVKGSAR